MSRDLVRDFFYLLFQSSYGSDFLRVSVFFVQENLLTWTNTVVLARIFGREGHVTLHMIFPLSCSGESIAMTFCLFFFLGEKTCEHKPTP